MTERVPTRYQIFRVPKIGFWSTRNPCTMFITVIRKIINNGGPKMKKSLIQIVT